MCMWGWWCCQCNWIWECCNRVYARTRVDCWEVLARKCSGSVKSRDAQCLSQNGVAATSMWTVTWMEDVGCESILKTCVQGIIVNWNGIAFSALSENVWHWCGGMMLSSMHLFVVGPPTSHIGVGQVNFPFGITQIQRLDWASMWGLRLESYQRMWGNASCVHVPYLWMSVILCVSSECIFSCLVLWGSGMIKPLGLCPQH